MEVGNQTKITRDDWISRFIGYLASLEYVYKKNDTNSPRVWNSGRKADNIVYIYGVPRGGKTRYKAMLESEIAALENVKHCNVSFAHIDSGLSNLHFQLKFCESFKNIGYRFPCLDLVASEKYDKVAAMFGLATDSMDNAKLLFSKDIVEKIKGAVGLFGDIRNGEDLFAKLSPEEQADINYLRGKLEESKESGQAINLMDDKQPYKYLQVSLATSTKHSKARTICLIDDFDLCEEKVPSVEEIFKFMYSVPNVIWVLFSDKNPSERIERHIPASNQWRMGGMNKARTLRYLLQSCPGMPNDWYEAIYQKTGGYYGLVNLCVDAHKAGKRVEMAEISTERVGTAGGGVRVIKDHKMEFQRRVDQWIKLVWNGGPWWVFGGEEEEYSEDPMLFLFPNEYAALKGNNNNMALRMFLPSLCYLAKCSKESMNNSNQLFCWKKQGKSMELNSTGSDAVALIETNTPFCIAVQEHKDMFFLDPVIIDFLSELEDFDEWLELFESKCKQHARGSIDEVKVTGAKEEEGPPKNQNSVSDYEASEFMKKMHWMEEQMLFMQKQMASVALVADAKEDTPLPKPEGESTQEGTGEEPETPPTPSPLDENKLTQVTLDKTDHEKDDDLPTEKVSEVVVKPVDDNDGDEKLEGPDENNDPKNRPPENE